MKDVRIVRADPARSDPMSYERFCRQVREFLVERRPDLDPARLTPAANLWKLGYLDSLGTIDLLFFLEEVLGTELPLTADFLQSFATIDDMYASFAAAGRAEGSRREGGA